MAGITEKKMQNKRFRTDEENIAVTVLSIEGTLSLNRLIKLAKLSRSTVYRHHGSVQMIVPNYEDYIIKRCQNMIEHLQNGPDPKLNNIFFRILILFSADRLYVKVVLKRGNHGFIERIIDILNPTILALCKIDNREVFHIYLKEVSGLIETWCEAGFDKDTLSTTVNKIMYLTSTITIRLSPLASFDEGHRPFRA